MMPAKTKLLLAGMMGMASTWGSNPIQPVSELNIKRDKVIYKYQKQRRTKNKIARLSRKRNRR